MKDTGTKFQAIFDKSNKTMSELRRYMGYSNPTPMYRLLRGEKPLSEASFSTAYKIAKFLDVDLEDLMDDEIINKYSGNNLRFRKMASTFVKERNRLIERDSADNRHYIIEVERNGDDCTVTAVTDQGTSTEHKLVGVYENDEISCYENNDFIDIEPYFNKMSIVANEEF